MMYYSTRDADRKAVFPLKRAAFMGLAPDGGLFMPESIPQADLDEVERLAGISYADMALYLSTLFFGDDIDSGALEVLVRRAYDFPCPINEIGPGIFALELFHGPTFAFKDFGARFMGGMLGELRESSETLVVLTATSGDTGSAVAAGFLGVPGIKVVVLYPKGKVSPLQESQMTTLGGNIRPVCVDGNFDDCQSLVKGVFNDAAFRRTHNVTSANSINILRWIPQSYYYFYAWTRWKAATGRSTPDVVVPSGNYGNITAGMLAAAMGLPVRRFVAGANANDVIPRFLRSGVYEPGPSVRTVANAMDVGAPSNYERMMDLFGGNFASLRDRLSGYAWSDVGIRESIEDIYARFGYVSDPHSAVGFLSYEASGADGFYLSTAHSAKFSEVIRESLGRDFPLPPALEAALKKEKKFHSMSNSLPELESYVDSILCSPCTD